MKIHLFQELLALNVEFGHVIHALERMEQEPTYKKEMIRWAKAHVESAQVEANRQFFDEFDAIVENDAIEAYKFLRDHTKRITDPDDIDEDPAACAESGKGMVAGRACRASRSCSRHDQRP